MKEHYVSYEQAVVLKRLGFAERTTYEYTEIVEGSGREEWDEDEQRMMFIEDINYYPKLRLDQAQKWLREVKDIIVIAEPDWKYEDVEIHSDYLTGKWYFVVWKDGERVNCNYDPHKEDEEIWLLDTYELALSAGIDKALELLGKEVKE